MTSSCVVMGLACQRAAESAFTRNLQITQIGFGDKSRRGEHGADQQFQESADRSCR